MAETHWWQTTSKCRIWKRNLEKLFFSTKQRKKLIALSEIFQFCSFLGTLSKQCCLLFVVVVCCRCCLLLSLLLFVVVIVAVVVVVVVIVVVVVVVFVFVIVIAYLSGSFWKCPPFLLPSPFLRPCWSARITSFAVSLAQTIFGEIVCWKYWNFQTIYS